MTLNFYIPTIRNDICYYRKVSIITSSYYAAFSIITIIFSTCTHDDYQGRFLIERLEPPTWLLIIGIP